MVCYYHRSVQAVGVCKNCHKGICEECAVDIGNGLACKSQCEAEVTIINQVFEREKVQALRLGSIYRRNAIGYGAVGAGILLIGALTFVVLPTLWISNSLLIVLGFWCLALASTNWMESKKHSGS